MTQRIHLGESPRGLIRGNHSAEPLRGIAQSRWKPPSTSEAEQSTLNNLRRELLKIYEHNKRAVLSDGTPPGAVVNIIIFLIRRGELPPGGEAPRGVTFAPKRKRWRQSWRCSRRYPIRSRLKSSDFLKRHLSKKFGHGLSEVGMIMGVSGVLVHLTFPFTTSVSSPILSLRNRSVGATPVCENTHQCSGRIGRVPILLCYIVPTKLT